MSVNDTHDDLVTDVNRGAGVAGAPAVTRIEKSVAFGTLADTANDVVEVFEFEDDTIVLTAWVEVTTASDGAANISLGKADGADLMGATSVATTGLKFSPSAKEFTLFAAGDTLDAHFSADATGLVAVVRALIVDAEGSDS